MRLCFLRFAFPASVRSNFTLPKERRVSEFNRLVSESEFLSAVISDTLRLMERAWDSDPAKKIKFMKLAIKKCASTADPDAAETALLVSFVDQHESKTQLSPDDVVSVYSSTTFGSQEERDHWLLYHFVSRAAARIEAAVIQTVLASSRRQPPLAIDSGVRTLYSIEPRVLWNLKQNIMAAIALANE